MKTSNKKFEKLVKEIELFFIEHKPTYLRKDYEADSVWDSPCLSKGGILGIENGDILTAAGSIHIKTWEDYMEFTDLCDLATSCQYKLKMVS